MKGEDFAALVKQYAAQQVRTLPDGRKVPWIDENLDPFTGEWLARKIMIDWDAKGIRKLAYRERGKDYNHSTFCDLVIAGLCGIVPQADGSIVVKPLAPAAWDWWCVDGVRYHQIIDKDTLMPAAYFDSLTVITKDSGLADALSTACFVMGPEGAEAFWRERSGSFDMILILTDGTIRVTGGISGDFSSSSPWSVIGK